MEQFHTGGFASYISATPLLKLTAPGHQLMRCCLHSSSQQQVLPWFSAPTYNRAGHPLAQQKPPSCKQNGGK